MHTFLQISLKALSLIIFHISKVLACFICFTRQLLQCTEVEFPSFMSGGFTQGPWFTTYCKFLECKRYMNCKVHFSADSWFSYLSERSRHLDKFDLSNSIKYVVVLLVSMLHPLIIYTVAVFEEFCPKITAACQINVVI